MTEKRRVRIKTRVTSARVNGVDSDSFKLGYQVGYREAEARLLDTIEELQKSIRLNDYYRQESNRRIDTLINENTSLADQAKGLQEHLLAMHKSTEALMQQLHWFESNVVLPDGVEKPGFTIEEAKAQVPCLDLARDKDTSVVAVIEGNKLNKIMSSVGRTLQAKMEKNALSALTGRTMSAEPPTVFSRYIYKSRNDHEEG